MNVNNTVGNFTPTMHHTTAYRDPVIIFILFFMRALGLGRLSTTKPSRTIASTDSSTVSAEIGSRFGAPPLLLLLPLLLALVDADALRGLVLSRVIILCTYNHNEMLRK